MKILNLFRHPLLSTLLLAAWLCPCAAQQQNCAQASPSDRTVLLFIAPPLGQQYQLRSGDVLSVRVFGHPELSAEVIIDERRMISLPFIDDVPAAGRTVGELRSEIVLRLQKLIGNPKVSVRLSESTQRERGAVYAGCDGGGRETAVYTSMLRSADLKLSWRLQSLNRGEFILSFFSRDSFRDGKDSYDVEALLYGGERLTLGQARKIFPTIVTAHNDPQLEIRLKVSLMALARMAKAVEVTMKLGDFAFKLRENDLAVLRFIASHFSSTAP